VQVVQKVGDRVGILKTIGCSGIGHYPIGIPGKQTQNDGLSGQKQRRTTELYSI
jgi:hypothetical protein